MQNGVISDIDSGRHFVIESQDEIENDDEKTRHRRRPKREIFEDQELGLNVEESKLEHHLVVISETGGASGGQCGLQAKNKQRLLAKPMLSQSQQDIIRTLKVVKRQVQQKQEDTTKKAIEIAVFVDDDLYRKTKNKDLGKDPILALQDLVFTYLHSVQLIYKSPALDVDFQLVLTRLEVFKNPLNALDKKEGDIGNIKRPLVLKYITQNVAFEFFNFGIFRQFLSY